MEKYFFGFCIALIFISCGKKKINDTERVVIIEKREPEHLMEVQLQDSKDVKLNALKLDTILVTQPDGTTLQVVGKGNKIITYAETTDGYTVVLNDKKIYEYAILSEEGALLPSGIKARSEGNRTKFETNYLKDTPKHLRFEGEKLKELLKKEAPKK